MKTSIPRRAVCALVALPLVTLAQPAGALQLSAKPSELLDAPLAVWLPLLEQMTQLIDAELVAGDALSRLRLIELRIAQTLIVQGREQWALVPAAAARARRLQEQESGRLTAGVVNELVAAQRLGRRSAAWLRRATADRFGAMSWDIVGSQLRQLQQQLQSSTADGLRSHAQMRMDLSTGISKGQVSLGFALQLLGLRLQLLHVLPLRDALVAGLGDVLALHPEPAAAPVPVQPASN